MLPKLVRDNIPDIIKADNATPVFHTADAEEYWVALKKKLSEEIQEFLEDESEEELADILEVLEAVYAFKQLDKESVEKNRVNKKSKRGGFEKRIILDEIT